MRTWLSHLDDLLRGKRTEPSLLATNQLNLPLPGFLILSIVLGATYGFFMGWFGLLNRTPTNYMQIVASMVKLPGVFLLTLLVTLPSLYVFNALMGCRLSFAATLKLLIAAIVVNLAIAASFGTILGFFTLSTTSYSFMVVLNVILMAISGLVGLGFLLRVLRRLALWQVAAQYGNGTAPPIAPLDPDGLAKLDPASREALLAARASNPPTNAADVVSPANAIFKLWVLIYALVGAQMSWLLRPFIGSPELPFEWFRPRSGNFFEAVAGALKVLSDGG